MHREMPDNIEIKKLLLAWRDGSTASRDKLFDLLYVELCNLSASALKGERQISLSTGDLVNEAVIRLVSLKHISWQDKAHFMALAARMMRRVLIEHARKKNSNKRQHRKVTLITEIAGMNAEILDAQLVESALLRLQVLDKDRAEIVEMRYFGGLSLKQIAEVTGKSPSTIQRSWRVSRAWLEQVISEARKSSSEGCLTSAPIGLS